MSHFDEHAIVHEIGDDKARSWLLQRVGENGYRSEFWCRITAAEGLLRVTGDFEPTVFAHGPVDPLACVAWMGGHQFDHYVLEKASIGTGGQDAISTWSVDDAREDIRAQLQIEVEEGMGEKPFACGLREALDSQVDHDGYLGCAALMSIIISHDYDSAVECLGTPGRRPAPSVMLAHGAVRRLHELLTASEAAQTAQTATGGQVPSDRALKDLAQTRPMALVDLLGSDHPAGDLARCASAAYYVADRTLIRGWLHDLAREHESQLVREACLQGLENDEDGETLDVLRHLAAKDPSPIVRDIARSELSRRGVP